MLKKILCFMFLFAVLFAVSVNAATIKVSNVGEDEITVEGESDSISSISVMVLNERYRIEDITSPDKNALQFYGITYAQNGKYALNIKLINSMEGEKGGGVFTFIINDSGTTETSTFEYYFIAKKAEMMGQVNGVSPEIYKSKLKEIYKVFSIDLEKLEGVTVDAIAVCIENMKNSQGILSEDVNEFYSKIRGALCVAAYNQGETTLFAENKLMFADAIGIEDTEIYSDYIESLNNSGRNAVNNAISNKNFKNISQIKNSFDESTVLNLIVNNNSTGYAHVEEIIDKYSSIFDKYNISTKQINKLTSKNKVYSSLAYSNADDLSDLYDIIKNSMDDNKSGGSSSGGTRTPIVSSGTANGDGYVMPETQSDELNKELDEKFPFEDVDEQEWAFPYISRLYKKGTIKGKTATQFQPKANITRGEFITLAYKAFFGEPQTENCIFDDVTDFSKKYVGASYDIGIVKGKEEDKFYPNSFISREESATILLRILEHNGIRLTMDEVLFTDDNDISPWSRPAVYSLKKAGVFAGRDGGRYYPQSCLTRAETAKIICVANDFLSSEK